MTITFIGHGYVGLVTAAVFADMGNKVWVIGHTPQKIEKLKKAILPIYEPGLQELVRHNTQSGRLIFTLNYDKAIPESEAIFIAVGTPSDENGQADLSVVYSVAGKIAAHLNNYTVIVTKSTVPVGTNKKIQLIVDKIKKKNAEIDIASIPEFLREGQAISDTLNPDRIIIGTESKRAEKILIDLHSPLLTRDEKIDHRMYLCDIKTAEMIKYASNAFLAVKISFANAISELAERVGADGLRILHGVGRDKRIGTSFLNAGAGFGGSCFPKDLKALIAIAQSYDYDFGLLKEVQAINNQATRQIVAKTQNLLKNDLKNAAISILGLSFKPDTDDMRDAPSIVIINELAKFGALLRIYDPIAMDNAKKIFSRHKNIKFATDPYDAVKNTDLLILITEWNEFKQLDMEKVKQLMRKHNLIDGRNIYEPQKLKKLGFNYLGVGR